MVVALGVTMRGDKVFLGFVQTDTENAVVIDGAKGLRSGVLAAFPGQIVIQRCQWHKRENVISHLPRAEQKRWRQRLQRAYQRPTYDEAVQELKALRHELAEVNQSAVASLDEGFEETLTLHRPRGLSPGRPVAQDHQRDRVRERPGRTALRSRGPLEELGLDASPARDRPA
jgi:hypothetical protein